MKNEKPICEKRLKPNIINKEIFNRENELCKMLSKENGGKCGWGVCKDCGVIPLLYKLHKGELIENPALIKKLKNKTIKQ